MAEVEEEVQVDLSQQLLEDLDSTDATLEPEQLDEALANCADFHANAEVIGADRPVSFTELLLADLDPEADAWQPGYEYVPAPRVLVGLTAGCTITSGF